MDIRSLHDLTFFRGRVALHAILKGLGINQGEVAIQAFTCIAVPEGVMAAGAKPLYIDIDPQRLTMDPQDLENKISSKTKLIVVQHTFGIPADMGRISLIAHKFNIPIVEDCAHTISATYKGKRVGLFGDAAFYSFEWGKPVIVGVGGSAKINNPDLLSKVRLRYESYEYPSFLREQRIKLQYLVHHLLYRPYLYWPLRSAFRALSSFGFAEGNYNPVEDGDTGIEDYSLRMSRYHNKLLVKKLHSYGDSISRKIISEYQTRITSSSVCHLTIPDDCDIVFARYPLITNHKIELLKKARRANVELADWYLTPVHPLTESEWPKTHYGAGSCPNAENVSKKIITLPAHSRVRERDIDRICHFLNNCKFS